MKKAKSFPAETQRIWTPLRLTLRRAGRGSMSQVARSLGLRSSYFSEKPERRERLDVGVLAMALGKLKVFLTAFFAELEGTVGHLPWDVAQALHERSTEETRRGVRIAYRRMRAELAGVDLVSELESTEEMPLAEASLGVEWLEDLDNRRQIEPEVVAGEIAENLHQVEAALLPRALGVWSSALRLLLELEVAADLNSWALRLAHAADDSATGADLYLRRSYIVADAGYHNQALTLAELAAGIFARRGDQAGKGRALVDCARALHYLGRSRKAIQAAKHTLDLSPSPTIRLAALQGLGLVHLKLGNLSEAERHAELAEPLAAR